MSEPVWLWQGTPTFDVADEPRREEDALARSRQIMEPQVRHGEMTSPTKPAAAPSDADRRAEVKVRGVVQSGTE